ncbi:rCG40733 [Rattus norvegicus]|uniref:RCG40733 n=1 Tax=Rattus norvegicus TaxID=10116 RepID=A6KSV8_RAT|nr:rCG40733 [Rattus norvegicus]
MRARALYSGSLIDASHSRDRKTQCSGCIMHPYKHPPRVFFQTGSLSAL